jgi:AraC-like DNA-binding protein
MATTSAVLADRTSSDLWRYRLSEAFAGLEPEPLTTGPMTGDLLGSSLGDLHTFRVSGSSQVVRRTSGTVRRQPTDALKVCLQIRGRAVVHQGDRELVIGPGHLGVYDTRRAYDLRLDGDPVDGMWESAVMAFPPGSLPLPRRWLSDLMAHVHDASQGPGTVLQSFVTAALEREGGTDSPSLRFADAGMQLLSSTLTMTLAAPADERAADGVRFAILEHVRQHVHDPDLCHRSVAADHRMSPRSLDRLFEDEPSSVTALIRDLRLDGARRDLLDPRARHQSVGAVAAWWCFPDPAHFSRLYKRRFGLSPACDRNR